MRAYVDFHGTLVVEALDDVDEDLLRKWMHRHTTNPTDSVVVLMKAPKQTEKEKQHDTWH